MTLTERMKELEEAASRPVWANNPCTGSSGGAECWQETPHQDIYVRDNATANYGSGVADISGDEPSDVANANLIVAARNAWPALTALVEAAETVCEPGGVNDAGGSAWWAAHDRLDAALADLRKALG